MPGLHISLGIFYRLFTLLESSCNEWDLELAQYASQPDTLHSYKLYSSAVHNLVKLKQELSANAKSEEANAADQLATFLAIRVMPQAQIDFSRQAASSMWKKIEDLVSMLIAHDLHVHVHSDRK